MLCVWKPSLMAVDPSEVSMQVAPPTPQPFLWPVGVLVPPWFSPQPDACSECPRGHVCAFCLHLGLPLGACGKLTLWFFCLNTHQSKGEVRAAEQRKTEPTQLKTKHLREYTLKCHSSMPRNNTYVNFERFARVVEDVARVDQGCRALAGAHDTIQDDVETLVSIYNEKEAWYREENERTRHDLSQLKYEFRKVESMKKLLREDIQAAGASLGGVARKLDHLQAQFEALRQELSTDLQWIQELVGSFQLESGSSDSPGSVFHRDTSESLSELLGRSCTEEVLAGWRL